MKSDTEDNALVSLLTVLKKNGTDVLSDAENGDDKTAPVTQQETEVSGAPPIAARYNHSNAQRKSFTLKDLRKYFHLPIVAVAKEFGVCTTMLKKLCRQNNIQRWPHRQIRSISNHIESLEYTLRNENISVDEAHRYRTQIQNLRKTIELIMEDPNTPSKIS
jgi:hypothetical protein